MRITKSQLRQVIREELERHLFEQAGDDKLEAAARLVHAALPSRHNTVKHGTMKSALEGGDWQSVIDQGAKFNVTPESAYEALADSVNFPGLRGDVLAAMFDGHRERDELKAISWAKEQDAEFGDDPAIADSMIVWVK